MNLKKRFMVSILAACILTAGAFSYIHLDFLSKANPGTVITALSSLVQNEPSAQGNGFGPPNGQQPPEGMMPGARPEGAREGGEPGGSAGMGNIAAFAGVFVSTAFATYLFDRLFRKRKAGALGN